MRAVSLLFHDVYLRDAGESGFRSEAANRYKLALTDFDAQLASLASARNEAPILARDPFRPDDHSGFPFLITVDDGGLSYYSVVADRLEARGWRGHCFVTTDLIGKPGFLDAAQIRELDARGHVIGSHSASHPARFSACGADQMRREWSHSREVLEDLLGHPVTEASVPGGYFSTAVAGAAWDAGVRLLFTSEPTTAVDRQRECTLIGRFPIRHGDRSDLATRLVGRSPWARFWAWTTWNAKGFVKPLLGSHYTQLADWLLASRALGRSS